MMLLVQQKGGSLIDAMMNEEGFWDKFLCGRKWKKKEWAGWIKDNSDWGLSWKEPEWWLPGEKQWFEGQTRGKNKTGRSMQNRRNTLKERERPTG
jgi:hypothetical protein